ncbi:hypothetical protein MLD38_010234 [Melastoma candidum]|uniref:Uncharacterized protein n=1 Tax=Melastoma candidum TaxID=119954 RepID=A0ACB9R0I1_9MYRT|nr:hypothetical protein MLD38_010234 [Melastoma candidum]
MGRAQIAGCPPIMSYRKDNLQPKKAEGDVTTPGIYVKVCLDGAPYPRKIDLKVYNWAPGSPLGQRTCSSSQLASIWRGRDTSNLTNLQRQGQRLDAALRPPGRC